MTNNDEQMAALREAILKSLSCMDSYCDQNGTTLEGDPNDPQPAQCEYCYRYRYPAADEIMQLITTTQAEAVRDALADVAKVSQEHKHAKTYKSEPAYKAGYNAGYTKAWRSRGGLGDGTETPGGKVITLTNTKDAV